MARTVSVTRYRWSEATPWAVNIPATIGGKRRREFFKTRQSAEKRKAELTSKIHLQGVESIRFGTDAVADVIDDYLTSKHGSSKRYYEGLMFHCSKMRETWGRLPVSSLTVRDVERLIDRPSWGARSRWNALGYVRAFLAWCERRDLIASNPAKKLSQEARRPDATKQILSPDEMRLLLRLTRREPVMRAFLVLGGFAGIRTAEIQRMDWRDISSAHGEIHVRPDAIKKTRGGWRERYVKIVPAFERHCPKGIGPIIPLTVRNFGKRQRRLRARMGKVSRRIGAPWAQRWQEDWPDNCLRHSFASYHLAMREDAGATAYQMGHTAPGTLYREYARAVRRQTAEKWWSI
jgi:integrase